MIKRMAVDKSSGVKKTKNKNWTLPETEQLVDQCVSGKGNKRHDGSFTTEAETTAFWIKTTEIVNAHGYVHRMVDEVKRKWTDLKSVTRRKQKSINDYTSKTGNGPPAPPLTPLEQKILTVVPISLVSGVSARGDNFKDRMIVKRKIACTVGHTTCTVTEEGEDTGATVDGEETGTNDEGEDNVTTEQPVKTVFVGNSMACKKREQNIDLVDNSLAGKKREQNTD